MTAHVLFIGGEDHSLRLPFLQAVAGRGFRVSVAATEDPAPFARAGLEYHRFRFERFLNPSADRAAIRALRSLLADVRPHLVHSFDTKLSVLVPLAARQASAPLVIRTINGLGWVYSSRTPLALALRPVHRVLHRLAARSTTATVFENRQDKDFFERHHLIGPGRSQLIPGAGVDVAQIDRVLAKASSAAALREQLGLGASKVVMTVTRLTRQKGIPTLLEAAAIVHRVRPDVQFLLVGPRESEGAFAVTQAEIDRHAPYVRATGPRTDVPALLGLADVFAFPTEYREGVPRVLLEAAVVGVPIVTTSMPGCIDVIRDGWSGFLVPPRAPGPLATKILALLDERESAKAMASRAADLVRREFGLTITVDRHCSLYSALLGQ